MGVFVFLFLLHFGTVQTVWYIFCFHFISMSWINTDVILETWEWNFTFLKKKLNMQIPIHNIQLKTIGFSEIYYLKYHDGCYVWRRNCLPTWNTWFQPVFHWSMCSLFSVLSGFFRVGLLCWRNCFFFVFLYFLLYIYLWFSCITFR